jgi:hypothetical protein
MAAWTVAQQGEGSPRDLVVIAHGGTPPTVLQYTPRACVVGVNYPPFKGNYKLGGMLPPLADLVRGALGSAPLGNLILVGFSEGCQAVRSWLAAGEVPSAVLVIDGAHASAPPDLKTQIQPWRDYFDRARWRKAHAIVTATRIPTTNYLPTAVVLPLITGFPPAPKMPAAVSGFAPVALALMGLSSAASIEQELRGHPWRVRVAGEEEPTWQQRGDYQQIREGYLMAQQWPGGDAAAHVAQAQKVMPSLLGEVYVWLANEPVSPYVRGYSSGDPPPIAPVGPYQPIPPGLLPTNPPGRPPAQPPSGPPLVGPAFGPPAPSSGGGAAAVAVLALFGLAALATRHLGDCSRLEIAAG